MKIYNSLTRKKEEFVPIVPGRIGMYICGPTVYDEPHIGHARSAYIFDIIRRYLEYKAFKVTFVRNVTDVDDKIIEKGKSVVSRQSSVVSLKEAVEGISKRYLDAYHEVMATLGIGKPDKEPKATEYIPEMVKFIETLIKRGCAYVSDGNVYFDIKKAASYGKLSNQNLDKMEAGMRVSPGENKNDPLDFALWKKAKEGEPSWTSPWGRGRPGWHIECSVMSSDILGDEFDIHGGGIDLIFPHHENEIAQSEGAGKRFARYWMHNGLLTINGEKMAKSLGNFISIKDFLAKYKDADYLKLFFLSAHYASPIDYMEAKIEEAKKEKERFFILLEKLNKILKDQNARKPHCTPTRCAMVKGFRENFEKAMDDDFNTPLALAAMFDLVTYANKFIQGKERFTPLEKAPVRKPLSSLTGFTKDEIAEIFEIKKLLAELSSIFRVDLSKEVLAVEVDKNQIMKLIKKRNKARAAKDFNEADRIRKRLSDMGIVLEDTKEGTGWRVKV